MIDVTLVSYTQFNPDLEFEKHIERRSQPEHILAMGKRICQTKKHLWEIEEEVDEYEGDLVKKRNLATLKSGHLGVLEHVSFTFLIEGGSRVMTHQLVRHRMASYLQMSQRAVPMEDLDFIIPPTIAKGKDLEISADNFDKLTDAIGLATQAYTILVEIGVPKGDARYVMPHGMETRVWMTINTRSLLHFFKERLINPGAQWEIKGVAKQMHKLVFEIMPDIFDLRYAERWE